jgi:hypothetical protein
VFGAGEVGELTRRVWADDAYCACGSRVRSCAFWGDVFRTWVGEDDNLLDEYLPGQAARETIVSWTRTFGSRRDRFWLRTRRLFALIRGASGRRIVVDSNKIPGRGFLLASTPGLEVYLVHLVRDPRAVVFSMTKSIKRTLEGGVQKDLEPKPLIRTALRWLIVNLAAEMLSARLGPKRAVRVRYEDFVADPRASLSRVLALVGRGAELLPDGRTVPIRPLHQVSGSRHRMQKNLLIDEDEAWQGSMSPARQAIVAAICAPLLRRYGYPWRAAATDRARQVLA